MCYFGIVTMWAASSNHPYTLDVLLYLLFSDENPREHPHSVRQLANDVRRNVDLIVDGLGTESERQRDIIRIFKA